MTHTINSKNQSHTAYIHITFPITWLLLLSITFAGYSYLTFSLFAGYFVCFCLLYVIVVDDNDVHSACISVDNRYLATISKGGINRFNYYDIETNRLLTSFTLTEQYDQLHFNPFNTSQIIALNYKRACIFHISPFSPFQLPIFTPLCVTIDAINGATNTNPTNSHSSTTAIVASNSSSLHSSIPRAFVSHLFVSSSKLILASNHGSLYLCTIPDVHHQTNINANNMAMDANNNEQTTDGNIYAFKHAFHFVIMHYAVNQLSNSVFFALSS